MTYDGVNTSFVLSDSNENLSAYTAPGSFAFDGIDLTGYHGSTLTNGVDTFSLDVTMEVPEPGVISLLGMAALLLGVLRRSRG